MRHWTLKVTLGNIKNQCLMKNKKKTHISNYQNRTQSVDTLQKLIFCENNNTCWNKLNIPQTPTKKIGNLN